MSVINRESRVHFVSQEIDICKQLASNNSQVRKKGLSSLKKLLASDQCSKITPKDADILWKGLFTYVWMSDTPLVQETDVEAISSFIHVIEPFDIVLLFIRGFFNSIASQWNRISHHRTDKFLMFVRRFLRQVFFRLKNDDWNESEIELVSSELYSVIQILPVGLVEHLNDIYNEEIAKVSGGNISTKALILLLKCYIDCIMNSKPSMAVVNNINSTIFSSLVRQLKLYIKQKAACALEMEGSEDSAEMHPPENGCENLDPRPGNAHVFLPYLDFDENIFAEYLENYLSLPQLTNKTKNILTQIIEMLRSVTKLRERVNEPVRLAIETTDKGRKRKKNKETVASLIKKACKKLEKETEDFVIPLRKLRKLQRLEAANKRNESWTITESTASDNQMKQKMNSSKGWTVNEIDKENQGVTNEIDEPTETQGNNNQSWIVTETDKLTTEANNSGDWTISDAISDHCESIVPSIDDKESCKIFEKYESSNDEESNHDISSKDEVCAPVKVIEMEKDKKIDSKTEKEILKHILEDVPGAGVDLEETETKEDESKEIVDGKTKEVDVEKSPEAGNQISEKKNEDNETSLKVDIDNGSEVIDLNETKSKLIKKRVSFCETPERIKLFHAREPTKSISEKDNISVPVSVVKNRPKLLIPGKKYSIVDFSKLTSHENDKNKLECVTESTLKVSEPDWKVISSQEKTENENAKKVEEDDENESSEEESDTEYHLDEFFKSPPKKRGRRSYRASVGPQEVRRSARLSSRTSLAKSQEK